MNAKMAAYGDMAVAGIGVAMKITMITGMVSMGIGQGVQPLLGYCTGARDWKRFRQYFRFSMIFATALGTGLTLLCYGGLNQLGGASVSSFIANISRQGMVYIPMLFVLGSLFGADGLVWAQPAADLVSFAVGIVMYVLTWRKMTGTEKSLMQAQS